MASIFDRLRQNKPEQDQAAEIAWGLPGVEPGQKEMDPELSKMLLSRAGNTKTITEDDVARGAEILRKYKDSKVSLENRIVDNDLWYRLRHWEVIGKNTKRSDDMPDPTSAWLFNSILNKHADAMDNYPEAVVLPREQSDEESAKILSSVLPVIMDNANFEETYSKNWWRKLEYGTAVYGVFWNQQKENGLGDIDIRQVDLLKIFWEPGITDIQESRNLFIVELIDDDLLDQMFPEKKGRLKGRSIEVKQYLYDDQVDTQDKSVVVDWYYKTRSVSGKNVVHLIKFVGNELLYASENDPAYRDSGFYDHGLYPVVFDVLFPEEGSPAGFGYVDICKDPQIYIDKLDAGIQKTAMMTAHPRYFASTSTNVNEKEFLDWNQPIVHVNGEIEDRRLKQIEIRQLDPTVVNIRQMKIDEMKETSANRDVNSGGYGSGVTAAAAIAALQEAGNKTSRDMINSSYNAHRKISKMCVELIRQFYDVERSFRITEPNSATGYKFTALSNKGLKDQETGIGMDGETLYRCPVFDLDIRAQKRNPFSRMAQNEIAKELYAMGFFNPQKAQEAMIALDMMDFEGIEGVRDKINKGQTLMALATQAMQENQQLKAALGIAQGQQGAPTMPATATPGASAPAAANGTGGSNGVGHSILEASQPMTGYGDALAKRSAPDMSATSDAATPGK